MKTNGNGRSDVNGQSSFCVCHRRNGNAADNGADVGRKIRQSILYMLEHLNQPLHVATLAAAVNVSPSHYSALFKRWTGCPPIDFFIHLRMQYACRLFDSTSLNVKEVAAELGYDDPFYFSRTFKAINRIAPSEYRMMPEGKKRTIKSAARPFGRLNQEQSLTGNNGNLWIQNREAMKGDGKNPSDADGFEPLNRKIEIHQPPLGKA
jgi:AraC-like DNA-binding protein